MNMKMRCSFLVLAVMLGGGAAAQAKSGSRDTRMPDHQRRDGARDGLLEGYDRDRNGCDAGGVRCDDLDELGSPRRRQTPGDWDRREDGDYGERGGGMFLGLADRFEPAPVVAKAGSVTEPKGSLVPYSKEAFENGRLRNASEVTATYSKGRTIVNVVEEMWPETIATHILVTVRQGDTEAATFILRLPEGYGIASVDRVDFQMTAGREADHLAQVVRVRGTAGTKDFEQVSFEASFRTVKLVVEDGCEMERELRYDEESKKFSFDPELTIKITK